MYTYIYIYIYILWDNGKESGTYNITQIQIILMTFAMPVIPKTLPNLQDVMVSLPFLRFRV